jgi:molybdate transport system substrate-binding protein
MRNKSFFLIFSCLLLLVSCSNGPDRTAADKSKTKGELTISAASSLYDVLTDVKEEFSKVHPSIDVTINFGGSGVLQQQILQGAPIDLFIFADKEKADHLVEQGLVEKNSAKEFLGNRLVVVQSTAKKTNIADMKDLLSPSIKKIAIGTPETVPAGKYAKQALENMGIWDQLESSGKLVPAKDVRQVLTYVETGNVDAGFIYKTDAQTSGKIKIIKEIPDDSHDPIIYSTGIVKTSKHKKEAAIFSEFLTGSKAKKIYQKYRFKVLE